MIILNLLLSLLLNSPQTDLLGLSIVSYKVTKKEIRFVCLIKNNSNDNIVLKNGNYLKNIKSKDLSKALNFVMLRISGFTDTLTMVSAGQPRFFNKRKIILPPKSEFVVTYNYQINDSSFNEKIAILKLGISKYSLSSSDYFINSIENPHCCIWTDSLIIPIKNAILIR